jgi:bifunctional non-homologous end joining protein LigD
MTLAAYRKKRDFKKTAEPKGHVSPRKPAAKGSLLYIIQKHDASRLHYDFRLELDGVLKSWAVPKGPSLDPSDKRLAVEVEDHPLEYGSFEGLIPQGEYGGGTVLLWDRGSWEPEEDPHDGLRTGKLKFTLHGEKLHGSWALIRKAPIDTGRGPVKNQWLLIKHRDEAARGHDEFDITAAETKSVTSGRDLDQIADDGDRVWSSKNGEQKVKAGNRKKFDANDHKSAQKAAAGKLSAKSAGNGKAARGVTKNSRSRSRAALPKHVQVQLATLVEAPPVGNAWVHEIKFDGYRMLSFVDGSDIRWETRNDLDWTARLPELTRVVAELGLRRAILDGEVVSLDDKGVSNFQLLQNSFRTGQQSRVVYMVFDLLFLDGLDLRDLPLEERKAKLAALKLPTARGPLRYSEHMDGDGDAFFHAAERQGLEGIISKRRDRPYIGGRGNEWLKIKCRQRAEFVVGGFTDPGGARNGLGALLVGYHDDAGKLKYAGRVGTGFTHKTLAKLLSTFLSLEVKKSPFADFPGSKTAKGVHWVRPEKVAQLEFSNWTQDNLLRQPSFQGLREDKPASEITRELPAPTPDEPSAKHKESCRSSAASKNGSAKASSRQARSRKKRAAAHSMHPTNSKPIDEKETEIAGVRITHPDRVFYPAEGITKGDLAHFYADYADWVLPHIVDRPLAIVRCPAGIAGQRFFQKHPGESAPAELRRVQIPETDGKATYLVVDDVKGLVALAQIAALELHVGGARAEKPDQPDQLVFDLDPAPDVRWPRVIASAEEVRAFLQELGLKSFVKTSGGKGLHVVAPIQRRQEWDAVSHFCQLIARAIERAAPERYVSKMSKAARKGKIFVDYLRNQRSATAVAPYSTRARPGAPIATPLTWKELPATTASDQFRLANIAGRLDDLRRDPWQEFGELRQSITAAAIRKLS